MISIELLRKQKILQSLDESILIDLAHHIRFEQFQKRDYIFHKGSIGDSLVLVLSGQLQIVTLSEDNREVGLSFVEAGDYCGELSIIDGLPRSASAIAATDCMVGFLPPPGVAGTMMRIGLTGNVCATVWLVVHSAAVKPMA